MTVRRHKTSHLPVVLGVLGFVGLGIGVPIVVGGSDRLELHTSSLVAAPRDRHAITDAVSLNGLSGIVAERGTISLSESYASRVMTGEAVAALLSGGSARLVLEGATLAIDRRGANTGDTALDVSPLAAALGDLNFETLSVRRSTLVVKGENGGAEAIGEINAEITKRKSALTAKGSVVVRGHKLALDATLALPTEKRAAGAAKAQALKFGLRGPMVEVSFDGRLTPAEAAILQGQGEATVKSLRDTARWLGLGWPAGPGLADFKIKGPVDWSRQGIAFQRATMQMDGNEAQGALSIGFAGDRLNVTGTLALQTLDLSRYVKAWRSETTRSLIEDVIGPGPFALPLVRYLDADLRISANKVRTGGVDLGQSAATLSVKRGKLLADIAEFAIDDARGTGQIIVDTNTAEPRYVVRGKLTDFDVSRLMPEAPGVVPLQGKGELVADITAVGDDASELFRTMSGKMSVSMPAGGRVGIDLKGLVAAAQKQPVNGWSQVRRGATMVDSLQGRLVLSEGVIYTEAFSAAMGDAMLTATGGGSLRSGVLDLRVLMAGRTTGERTAHAAAALTGQADAIVLKGPWHEPSIRAETVSGPDAPPPGRRR